MPCPILPTGLVTGYSAMAERLWTMLSTVLHGDFHLFGPIKKHLADKWLAADADMKLAVTWLQTLDSNFIYAGIQTLVPVLLSGFSYLDTECL
jgi:hypothetical protein